MHPCARQDAQSRAEGGTAGLGTPSAAHSSTALLLRAASPRPAPTEGPTDRQSKPAWEAPALGQGSQESSRGCGAAGAAQGRRGEGSLLPGSLRDARPPALGGARWHWLTPACSAIHTGTSSRTREVTKPQSRPGEAPI